MRTRCADIELELAGFAAGELDEPTADAVARHVVACAGCRDELSHELALRRTLADLPRVPAPRGLDLRPPAAAPRRRRRPAVFAAAATLAAAVVLAVVLGDSPRSGRPTAPEAAGYDAAQIAAARRDAAYGLVLAARILERSEKRTVADVFGHRLPRAVTESLRADPPSPEGGQG